MADTYRIKQYILTNMKNDWTHGKRAVQAAHASMSVFFQRFEPVIDLKTNEKMYLCPVTDDMSEWIEGSFAKIGLKIDSRDSIEAGLILAREVGVPCSIIKDNGTTQDEGDEGVTAAIGPFDVTDPGYSILVQWLKGWKLW